MITSDLAAAIQHAVASNTVVRGVGSGTWLHGGPVENDDTATRVQPPSGVIEYTPGDLVITVHAGTTLEELSAVCAASGQMLAIAPYGSPQSTIGAVVATASAAPLSYEDLTIRDLVLGLTVVTGTGDVVRVGGKVVKNVAGFDLVRLNTGAFGTLGIITEVRVRLHAKPIMDHVVTGTLADAPTAWVPRTARHAPGPWWRAWLRAAHRTVHPTDKRSRRRDSRGTGRYAARWWDRRVRYRRRACDA